MTLYKRSVERNRYQNQSFNPTNNLSILRGKEFWYWDKRIHKQQYLDTGGSCCFNHCIGLPEKDGIQHPLYPYEQLLYNSLQECPYLFCNKATGLGISEFMLRYIAWLCTKDDQLADTQVCIVTGPNIQLAVKLIDRMKDLFYDIQVFENKNTTLELNNVHIEAYPSHHLSAMRSLKNPKFILIDEGDWFSKSQQLEVRKVSERYIAKSNPFIVFISTPAAPNQLFEQMQKEDPSMYRKFILDYSYGLNRIYSKEEIQKQMKSPDFKQEYCCQYLGLQGNTFKMLDITNSIKRFEDLKLEQIPHNQGGAYFIGVDIASGSSNTAITVSQRLRDPNVVRILYSEEFVKPSSSEVIDILHRLRLKFGISYCYFFVDASAAMFCRELCISMGLDPNYDLKTISAENSYVIPVVWSVEGRKMLSNMEYIVNKGYLALDPKLDKVITALKTAYSEDWKLDKDRTSYDDTLDSLLLSCKGYNVTPKES